MKINEIITESPADIKLLLMTMGYDLYFIRNTSNKIKKQFITYNGSIHKDGMTSYLTTLNLRILQISALPQWTEWGKTADGKSVQRELDKLFNDNMEFMKKYGN